MIVGTTGESPTVSHEEHLDVIRCTIGTARGRVPVIAGTGSNSTDEAIELTKHAKKAGVDAALVVTCAVGHRASLAASMLLRRGAHDVGLFDYSLGANNGVDRKGKVSAAALPLTRN